jgi:glycosyltransferase involved in cell wall biosynthesis
VLRSNAREVYSCTRVVMGHKDRGVSGRLWVDRMGTLRWRPRSGQMLKSTTPHNMIDGTSGSAGTGAPERPGKILVCVTEDWFALSHFQPLLRRLRGVARDVVVVARDSGRMDALAALGVRTIALDYNRASLNPARELRTVRALRRIVADERPDVVHMIAMKPIVLAGLALWGGRRPRAVVHMTGLGFLAISDTMKARLACRVALAIIAHTLRQPQSWLLVENPEDLEFLRDGGVDPGVRVTMLGGAGIDPVAYPARADPANPIPVAAFVARMIRSKGVHVLMEAARLLAERRVPLVIDLWGETDDGNPDAIPSETLARWSDSTRTRYRGFTRDVARVWETADIFVLPAISREGMPRALLEAAASARPLVVTDVPGCRHFVTDGVEGLIVPPGDASALADALARLAGDAALRTRLGAAARAKVLAGYTEAAVEAGVETAYRALSVL